MMQTQRHQPPGETSESPQRPSQQLAALSLQFDLAAEVNELHREESWQRGDRNGKTLVRQPHLHATLTALKAGAHLDRHETEGPLTLQVLAGQLRVTLLGDTVQLEAGKFLALEAGVAHEVHAVEDSAFLLTLGWPR